MDILSYTVSGMAIGAVVSTFTSANQRKWKYLLIGAFGGAFPDIDAISLWSKFDTTFGKWFHLTHSGEEIYCGKFWYSHHGFFHSILAMALLGSLFIFIPYLKSKITKKSVVLKTKRYWALAFFLAGLCHILEEMPTPDNIWGGVRIFFPFEMYVGGWNDIWWWNNYDLFLIIFCTCVMTITIAYSKIFNPWKSGINGGVLLLGVLFYCYQVHTRPNFILDACSNEYPKIEEQSKRVQQAILPPLLYETMEQLDQQLPIYF